MAIKSTFLSLFIYCAKTSNVRKVYIANLLSFLYCAKTFDVMKVYIAKFVLFEDIQCHESLHCYHFCSVRRHPASRTSTLISLIVRRHQERLHKHYNNCGKISVPSRLYFLRYPMSRKSITLNLYFAKTSNFRKVYIVNTFGRHPMSWKSTYIANTFVLCTDIQYQEYDVDNAI